jgi:hypothetical protein
MWRPRDRERYIGGYDPEHEIPDPERDPGDRWQSRAYRRNARDSRVPYRWNPDRFESRWGRDERDARDRYFFERGFDRGFEEARRGGYPGEGPYYEGEFGPGSFRGELYRGREWERSARDEEWDDRLDRHRNRW